MGRASPRRPADPKEPKAPSGLLARSTPCPNPGTSVDWAPGGSSFGASPTKRVGEGLRRARGCGVLFVGLGDELEADPQGGRDAAGWVPGHRQPAAALGAVRTEGGDEGEAAGTDAPTDGFEVRVPARRIDEEVEHGAVVPEVDAVLVEERRRRVPDDPVDGAGRRRGAPGSGRAPRPRCPPPRCSRSLGPADRPRGSMPRPRHRPHGRERRAPSRRSGRGIARCAVGTS